MGQDVIIQILTVLGTAIASIYGTIKLSKKETQDNRIQEFDNIIQANSLFREEIRKDLKAAREEIVQLKDELEKARHAIRQLTDELERAKDTVEKLKSELVMKDNLLKKMSS